MTPSLRSTNVSTAARGEPEKTAETFAVKVWVASASEVERERAITGAANLRNDDYVHDYNQGVAISLKN